jgi:hypothetical protein
VHIVPINVISSLAILSMHGSIKDHVFWPWWVSFDFTDCMLGFMGPDKLCSLVTSLSNCTSML